MLITFISIAIIAQASCYYFISNYTEVFHIKTIFENNASIALFEDDHNAYSERDGHLSKNTISDIYGKKYNIYLYIRGVDDNINLMM